MILGYTKLSMLFNYMKWLVPVFPSGFVYCTVGLVIVLVDVMFQLKLQPPKKIRLWIAISIKRSRVVVGFWCFGLGILGQAKKKIVRNSQRHTELIYLIFTLAHLALYK